MSRDREELMRALRKIRGLTAVSSPLRLYRTSSSRIFFNQVGNNRSSPTDVANYKTYCMGCLVHWTAVIISCTECAQGQGPPCQWIG